MKRFLCAAILAVFAPIFVTAPAKAGIATLALGAESTSNLASAQNGLVSTGLFSQVDTFNSASGSPSLSQLLNYDSVLAWSNFTPQNPTFLGNVLADYVDAGGHVVVATYGISSPWAIQGRIMTAGYSPLTNVGTNGTVTGNIVPTMPGDPIFNGVNPAAISFQNNFNYAHPGLDAGATLLATDGAGKRMLARNAAGNVLAANIWPGGNTNAEADRLLANMLLPTPSNIVPEPTSMAIFGVAALLTLPNRRRRRSG